MNKLSPSFAPILGVILLVTGGILYAFYIFVASIPQPNLAATDDRLIESNDPLISKVQNKIISWPTLRPENFTLGSVEAPVKIYEFSDFSCPYCKTMAASLKAAASRHPEVQLIWKDFPVTSLHPESVAAHQAAWCAGEQNKFWEYHDKLFEAQGNFSRAAYLSIAQALELKLSSFTACLDDTTPLQIIAANVQEGNDLNIDGTPYLFIGDQKISGVISDEELEQVISLQKQLNQANKK